MFFSLLADTSTNFFQQYWIVFVLLAAVVLLYVFSFIRRKKVTEQTKQMMDTLKPGVKVKTYSGFYGTIISIKETTDGKIVLLETGEGSKVSYTTIDANAIYGVDLKEDVIYDKDGNIVEPNAPKTVAVPAIAAPTENKKSVKSKEKTEVPTKEKVTVVEQPKKEDKATEIKASKKEIISQNNEVVADQSKKDNKPAEVKDAKSKTTTAKKSTKTKKSAK